MARVSHQTTRTTIAPTAGARPLADTLTMLRRNLLREEDGFWLINDCTDYRMALSPGDEISVMRETARGVQCKFHGISGWYDGKLE